MSALFKWDLPPLSKCRLASARRFAASTLGPFRTASCRRFDAFHEGIWHSQNGDVAMGPWQMFYGNCQK